MQVERGILLRFYFLVADGCVTQSLRALEEGLAAYQVVGVGNGSPSLRRVAGLRG